MPATPPHTVPVGVSVTFGNATTVRMAPFELAAGGQAPLTTHRYRSPFMAKVVGLMVSVAVVTPEYGAPLARLLYVAPPFVLSCH